MKPHAKLFAVEASSVLFIGLTAALPHAAASTAPETPPGSVLSVFVQPSNSREGCDPFFPKSSRPYVVKPGETIKLESSSLVVKGITTVNNRKLVVINNRTLGVGDSDTVTTPQGKLNIRCIEINVNNVVIEANGQRHTLPL